jgi:alpha-mannosidase
VLPYVHPPAVHPYAERGPVASAAASLLKLDIGQLVLTRLERNGTGVALTLLNPADDPQTATIGSGTFELKRAVRTSLAGEDLEPLSGDGSVELSVAPRAWVRVALYAD